MSRRSVMIVVCVGLLLLLGSACSSGEGRVVSPTEGKSSASNSMLVSDPRQGLNSLSSFHMHSLSEFTGTVEGKAQNSKMEIDGDEVRDAKIEFVQLKDSESEGISRSILMGVVGDASYSRIGDEKDRCRVSWNAGVNAPPAIWPVDLLPAIRSANKEEAETIGNVKTIHYTLTKDSLDGFEPESVSGDLWLAEGDGYVVKLDLAISGSDRTFGKGRNGTRKIFYELSKINSNEGFTLPAGCQSILMDLPMMPDATRISRTTDTFRYATKSTIDEILTFYKDELSSSGWQSGDTHPFANDGQIILFFKPEITDSLQVAVIPGSGGLVVSVSQLKAPEMQQPAADEIATPTPEPLDPAEAGLPEGIPLYPDAENYTGIPGIKLAFTTTDPADEVMKFYKTDLVKKGWTVMPGSQATPDVPLMLRKDNITLMIRVIENEGSNQIEIITLKQ